ncbi:MAG: Do family serine endopeptidase, partial [Rhodanobacter sp.]
MNPKLLRHLACALLLGSVGTFGVHAQTPVAASSLPDFTGIVQKNAPAVVHVEARYDSGRTPASRPGARGPGMPGGPQDEILRRFFGMPDMPAPQQRGTSVGSGFIISSDGYVLTNNHVVAGADKVTIRLQDRRTLTARVIGTDPTYDIALLKIDAGGSLPALTIGDSRNLRPGQWVLAIGSPFGFDYTVTQGIVSAVGRNLGERDQAYTSFIQTDVPINRGNSGGPLFNLQGQVVGINSQIYSNTGAYSGVSFSIPIDVAMNAVQQIKSKGYVSRGMLGVMVQAVDDNIASTFKLDNGTGAAVVDVTPDSGAAKAGLRAGDIILEYGGRPVQQSSDLPPMVGMSKPGSSVPVVILRDGKRQTVQVTIGETPRDQRGVSNPEIAGDGAASGSAALGLDVKALDADTRKQMGLGADQGVIVSDVTGAVAGQAGLQAGDVILMVGQQRVGSVAAFETATKAIKPGSTVLLLVRRGEQSSFIGLTVPAAK